MKIGCLLCGYRCEEGLEERLQPWFNLASQENLIFSCVSTLFKEYEDMGQQYDNQATELILLQLLEDKKIQYLHLPQKALFEHEARSLALQSLLEKEECDYVWLLDILDESYTEPQIASIVRFVKLNPYIIWFSIPLKNYIFSGKEWIDGYCPPRIFKVNSDKLKLNSCYWDNDFNYVNRLDKYKMSYKELSHLKIPKTLLNGGIRHMTWLHKEGKEKVAYQLKHFGHCGYKWNEEKQELEFDLEYYKKTGELVPQVYVDE